MVYHSTKIAKARPGFDDSAEHPSVQINSSSPWLNQPSIKEFNQAFYVINGTDFL